MATRHLPLAGGHVSGYAQTARTDKWWTGPAATFTVLSLFVVYTTWAALQGDNYYADPYLSPFYSPVLFTNPSVQGGAPLEHSWFGLFPSWWPSFIPASPAILILAFPGSFRFTCYYYRKAYYRSFAGSPPGCAVGPLASSRPYRGETALLFFQNLHRYALYAALAFIPLLTWDAILAFSKGGKLGVGVGSLIICINVVLLSSYAFGCHSFRHLIGGGKDCMSCGKNTVQLGAWKKATWFNQRHMQFAWLSLFWVMFTDLYIRLVASGVITDLNTWN